MTACDYVTLAVANRNRIKWQLSYDHVQKVYRLLTDVVGKAFQDGVILK